MALCYVSRSLVLISANVAFSKRPQVKLCHSHSCALKLARFLNFARPWIFAAAINNYSTVKSISIEDMQRRGGSSSHANERGSVGVQPVACAADLLACEKITRNGGGDFNERGASQTCCSRILSGGVQKQDRSAAAGT